MRLASLITEIGDPGAAHTTAYSTLGFAGFGVSVAGVLGLIPVVAAIFAGLAGGIAYTLMIFRDPAVQTWLARRKQRKQSDQIRKLRSQQLIVNARIDALEKMNVVKKEVAATVEVARVIAAAELKSSPPN